MRRMPGLDAKEHLVPNLQYVLPLAAGSFECGEFLPHIKRTS
jgi:hypothetical protein